MARTTRRTTERRNLAALLASKEMVIVCGSGGTGKTTIAAALGAHVAARMGGRVLVLTVDPARRLAVALGLGSLGVDAGGNRPVRVPDEAFADLGDPPRGELWMAMLDTKAGWDELITRHAPDAATRERVLANSLYRNITGRFVNSHDYLAMEQLHDLHTSGEYDLVVIDTPPSRNALDLLDAPGRMREFFGSRLLKWLTVPYRSRLFSVASKPFAQIADRVLGATFLRDIGEFFSLFQSMEAGFVQRAGDVERLLTDEATTFVVVSTLESAPSREARHLVEALSERKMPLGALVLNRVLPDEVTKPGVSRAATTLAHLDADTVATIAAEADLEAATVQHALRLMSDQFVETKVAADREAERRSDLAQLVPITVAVPLRSNDVHDVSGLLEIGSELLGDQ